MNKEQLMNALITFVVVVGALLITNKILGQEPMAYNDPDNPVNRTEFVDMSWDLSTAYFGMGYSNIVGVGGVSIEGGMANEDGRGWYLGLEGGSSSGGANEAVGMYGGISASFSKGYILKQGISFGGGSTGNTVTDLSAYGLGNLIGTDGADFGYIGYDMGFQFPLADWLAVSTTASITTAGPIFRASLVIRQ